MPKAKRRRTKKPAARPPYIDRGEPLPQSYAENRIVALVRSPEQVFLSWDIKSEARVAGASQVVRVHDLAAQRSDDLEPPPGTDNWYLRVSPNRTFLFELFERRGALLRRLAVSQEATTPVRWAGETGQFIPAEIVQAARHPISRRPAAPPGGELAALRPLPAEAAAAGAHRAPGAAEATRAAEVADRLIATPPPDGLIATPPPPDWLIGALPDEAAGPPPTPISAPREKVFGADYSGGK